jgi:hypothetical protein
MRAFLGEHAILWALTERTAKSFAGKASSKYAGARSLRVNSDVDEDVGV